MTDADKLQAYSDGKMAAAKGRSILRDNPYISPKLREFWRQGYRDSKADMDIGFIQR